MNYKENTDKVKNDFAIIQKEFLTIKETANYLGITKSYLYKLTSTKKIPYYKPFGKLCLFDRKELEKWLHKNRIATDEELNQKALIYNLKKGGKK